MTAATVPVQRGVPDEPGPPLPHGDRIHLPGRGTTFVRRVDGPAGAPTVLLLHGWIASGGLNWFQCFEPLAEHFTVLAVDHRGHGRGIRTRRRFRLRDCADDAAAVLEQLGTGPVIAVGYSMGGPIAQLLWKRHRHLVDGLVLIATAQRVVPGVRERMIFTSAMSAMAGTTRFGQLLARLPSGAVRRIPFLPEPGGRPDTLRAWAAAEMGRHDWRMVLEAGNAVGRFNSRKWLGDVDVPTAVVVTTKDRGLHPLVQMRMALTIPHAAIHRLDAGHTVCVHRWFGREVTSVCQSVAADVGAARSAG